MQKSPFFKYLFLCLVFFFHYALSGQNCSISDVIAEVNECNDDGFFYVDIEFEYRDVGIQGFEIRGNGVSYGDTFQYGQAFYTVGPLAGDCSTLYEFVVIDNENTSCSSFLEFDEAICCNIPDCEVNVVDVSLGDCDSIGYRTLTFDVEREGATNLGFDLTYQGAPLTNFDYESGPYLVTLPGVQWVNQLLLKDQEDPTCQTIIEFENENCEEYEECDFLFSNITREFVCKSDTTYEVFINVNYNGSSDSLFLVFRDEEPLLFSVNSFPISIGEFEISNELFVFAVHDSENIFCYTDSEWNDAPDCSSFENCEISRVFAEAQECDENGLFFVDIEFQAEGIGDLGFEIRGNGVSYGNDFQYGKAFYTIGPLQGDCNTIYEFVVIDNANANCSAFFEFEESICCDDIVECDIRDIEIDSLLCNEDGTYSMILNFIFEGVTNDFFEVWAGNEYIGFYAYEDLPVYIDTFYSRDVEYDLIRICDNDNDACCEEFEFIGPNCEASTDCIISEVFAEAYECDEDGNFLVDIEFDYVNQGDQGFTIRGNGTVYGDGFQYGETFYTIGPIEGDCSTLLEFIVIDNANPDCNAFYGFDEPVCCNDEMECDIRDIEVSSFSCNDDGTYSLTLNFIYEGVTNDFFDVWAGNEYVGFYAYEDLPVFIDTFYARDVEFDLIRICDNDNSSCCEVFEFIGPNCEEASTCSISEVFAEAYECDEDGNFLVDIEFDYVNQGDQGFTIRGNGTVYGDGFQYGETFYTIGPIEGDCSTLLEFIVIDNANPDCNAFYGFDEPVCCNDEMECDIRDIEVSSFSCNDDGTYSLTLNFIYEGVTNDFFDVWAGNEYVGFYAYEDLPVFIDTFYARDVEFDLIRICDNDNSSCCEVFEFIGPNCEEASTCSISEVFAEAYECDEDGNFLVDIEFDYVNQGDQGFTIRGNGTVYGEDFQYGETFYTIGPIEGDCSTLLEFIVIDNADPDCNAFYGFDEPVCCNDEVECNIFDVVIDSLYCLDNGTYSLLLNFEFEGVTNDFFDIWSDNKYIGFYAYEDLPINIANFIPRDREYDLITICDNDNENCCVEHEFIGPECDDIIDSTHDNILKGVNVYSYDKKLMIEQEADLKLDISIYSLDGKLISNFEDQGQIIKSTGVIDGVYIINIIELTNGKSMSRLIYF